MPGPIAPFLCRPAENALLQPVQHYIYSTGTGSLEGASACLDSVEDLCNSGGSCSYRLRHSAHGYPDVSVAVKKVWSSAGSLKLESQTLEKDNVSLAAPTQRMASAAASLLQSSASLAFSCPCKSSRLSQKAALSSPCSSFLQSATLFDTASSRLTLTKGGDKRLGRARCQVSDGAAVERGVSRRDICVGGLGAALLTSVQSLEVAEARDAEVRAQQSSN